ncbi:hypothetical protein [Chloroflexus aurantiacus]
MGVRFLRFRRTYILPETHRLTLRPNRLGFVHLMMPSPVANGGTCQTPLVSPNAHIALGPPTRPAGLCSSDDTLTGGERLYLPDALCFAERAYCP